MCKVVKKQKSDAGASIVKAIDPSDPGALPHKTGGFQITCLYVGQGDCIIITTPKYKHDGETGSRSDTIMIDCGSSGGINKKNEEKFQTYLPKKIDFLIITHADNDHHNLLGKGYLNNISQVENTIIGDTSESSTTDPGKIFNEWKQKFLKSTKNSLDAVRGLGCNKIIGLTINKDKQGYKKITFKVISKKVQSNLETKALTQSGYNVCKGTFKDEASNNINFSVDIIAAQVEAHNPDSSEGSNAVSLVTLFTIGEAGKVKKALFTGDANQNTFDYLLDIHNKKIVPLQDVELLQIPHHGSDNYVNYLGQLIAVTKPQRLFTSVKFKETVYCLPRWNTIKRWKGNELIEMSDQKDHYIGYWITYTELMLKRIGTTTNLNQKKINTAIINEAFKKEVTEIIDSITPNQLNCLKYNANDVEREKSLYAIVKKQFKGGETLIFLIQYTKKNICTNGITAINKYLLKKIEEALQNSKKTRSGKAYYIPIDMKKVIEESFDEMDANQYILSA